ncbi:MAG: hypothetical protein OEV49_07140 [candidate division Zixibacteria bacterium]|nr:hypothetical protein [candidate division Zixibacteria bacterium]MDH3938769.1 hypothetical protein [candidate division Zixibacteria bacterium]MDH4035374.1 hypothetical protein [candidate division Zixibacteria bacterium]
MDYGRIIGDSFRIAWQHKSLWVFGLFAGTVGSGLSFDPSARDFFLRGSEWRESVESAGSLIGMELVFAWIMIVFVIGLILMAMHLVCLPALIDSVNKIVRGGLFQLSSSFSVGLDFFWRFLGLALISITIGLIGFGLSVMVGLAMPDVDTAILAIAALLFLPVVLFVSFLLSSIFALAQRAMVVRNVGIADGLHEGFELLRQNLGRSLLVFLIYIGLSIGMAFGLVVILLIIAIPAILVVVIAEDAWVLMVILGFLFGLPLLMAMIAFISTALQNLYTLFYFELVEPRGQVPPGSATPAAPIA